MAGSDSINDAYWCVTVIGLQKYDEDGAIFLKVNHAEFNFKNFSNQEEHYAKFRHHVWEGFVRRSTNFRETRFYNLQKQKPYKNAIKLKIIRVSVTAQASSKNDPLGFQRFASR